MPSDLAAIAGIGQPGWIALAGPSGAGKDTLLQAVRAELAGDRRFHFARRSITRPEGAGDEPHEGLTPEAYEAALADGEFLLHWRAHGLGYGIRHEEAPTDRVVVLSVSRAVLREAAALRPLTVIEVTAPPALLAARLAARGREDAAAIAARLARDVPLPEGLDMLRVLNDGPVERGAARLRSALEAVAASCLPGGFRP